MSIYLVYRRALWRAVIFPAIGLILFAGSAYLAWKDVAIRKIKASGGWVSYDRTFELPDWLGGSLTEKLCQGVLPPTGIHLEQCAKVDDVLWWSWPLVVTARELTFWECGLNDTSIRLIPRASRLQVLAIHKGEITDASIEYLAGFRSLQELFIIETRISAQGAKSLQAAMPRCKIYWQKKSSIVRKGHSIQRHASANIRRMVHVRWEDDVEGS
jgi:hypothetical protein